MARDALARQQSGHVAGEINRNSSADRSTGARSPSTGSTESRPTSGSPSTGSSRFRSGGPRSTGTRSTSPRSAGPGSRNDRPDATRRRDEQSDRQDEGGRLKRSHVSYSGQHSRVVPR